MPNVVKGDSMVRLLQYLAGPGRRNEHTDQRIIAGDVVTEAVYRGRIDVARATELGKLLDSPRQTVLRGEPVRVTHRRKAQELIAEGMDRRAAYEAATRDENVWHCSLSLRPDEDALTDETWAAVARDFLTEMGYIGRDDVPDVRWAAVHHGRSIEGNDHIHLALSVVRPDGSLIDTRGDFGRSQRAANILEHRYGLQVLASREEQVGTERGRAPGEMRRAARLDAPGTDRDRLHRQVRALAAASDSEAEWLRAVQDAGVLVRPHFAKGSTDRVTGYAVKIPERRDPTTGKNLTSLWYGGLRLADDMTLPALRTWANWDTSPTAQQAALEEWQRIHANSGKGGPAAASGARAGRGQARLDTRLAIDQLARFSDEVRRIPEADRAAWGQAASQTAGALAAWSSRTERRPGPLDRMARQMARAGSVPPQQRRPYAVSTDLRAVSRMLMMTSSPAHSNLALLYALTDCVRTIMAMLEATDRARAAEQAATTARRGLTVIHMKQAGIDHKRPYSRAEGSPAWSCAARASVIVDGLDPVEWETTIKRKRGEWEVRRMATIDSPTVDEYGHFLRRPSPVRGRASAPLTPPAPGRPPQQGPGRTPPTPPGMRPENRRGHPPGRGRGR